MFGCPRIIDLVGRHHRGSDLRDEVLASLQAFCGEDWEQEDDITMVILERTEYQASDFEVAPPLVMEDTPRVLDDFSLPSIEGNERLAMQHVADAVADLGLPTDKLEKLKTAVAEATMNAIEHGNENDPDKNVDIRVEATADTIRVTVVDLGGEREASPSVTPDLDLKLAGEQTPRGWGLFLIKSMVDELNVSTDGVHHTVELVLYLRGGE
jgi:anti-sigma regulatory factor (Ser/Thr protein kinase)